MHIAQWRKRRERSTRTTCGGSRRPRRTAWWSARRRASCTRTSRDASRSRSPSTRPSRAERYMYELQTRGRGADDRLIRRWRWRLVAPQGPVALARDHHDVSGADSPFRETSNIADGSAFCAGNAYIASDSYLYEYEYIARCVRRFADMSVQNVIGDSFRGATLVALHNGGGVGWGEVMNGGFMLVLDGTHVSSLRAHSPNRHRLFWNRDGHGPGRPRAGPGRAVTFRPAGRTGLNGPKIF